MHNDVDQFLRVLGTFALAEDSDQRAYLLEWGQEEAALIHNNGHPVHILRYRAENESALLSRMKEVCQTLQQSGGDLVLVGGPSTMVKLAKRARPFLSIGRIDIYHLDDSGKVSSAASGRFPTGGLTFAFLQALKNWEKGDEERLAEALEENAQEAIELQKESVEFIRALQDRRSWATSALILVLSSVYGLEFLFGGTESVITLTRMGALNQEQILGYGEWWRLLSATFLHAGPMHALFNIFVLWSLGSKLERLLGTSRFLVLYGASAIGGSLLSLVFIGDNFGVGASGALWGLLAAEAAIAYGRTDLIPTVMIAQLRKTAWINLVINVCNSFRPGVDWAAHFGGGIVGGILILTGALVVGLIRPGEETPFPPRASSLIRGLAIGLSVLLLAGLGAGLVNAFTTQ